MLNDAEVENDERNSGVKLSVFFISYEEQNILSVTVLKDFTCQLSWPALKAN